MPSDRQYASNEWSEMIKDRDKNPDKYKHTKVSHTPGPWSYDEASHIITGTIGGYLAGYVVAKCDYAPDARLIAAAPTMKELLQSAKAAIEGHPYEPPAATVRAINELLEGL